MENIWIQTIRDELVAIPADEGMFIEEMLGVVDSNKFIKEEYGL